jgi:transposase InsO family protein
MTTVRNVIQVLAFFNAGQLHFDFKKKFFDYENSVKFYDTSRCSYTFDGYGAETAGLTVLNTTNDSSVYLRGDVVSHLPLKYDEYSYLYEYGVYNTRVKISMPDDPTILKKKKKVYVKENKNRARAAQFQRNRMAMILDTGSQIHLFYDSRFLRNMRSTRRRILDVNGGAVEIDTEGDVGLLQNVLVSTRSPRNIISGTLLMQMGLHFYTTGDYLFICDKDNNFVSMGRRNKNNLIYMRDMNLLRDDIRDELVLVAREDTTDERNSAAQKNGSCPNRLKKYGAGVNILNLLHNRFGHLPEKKLKAIAKNGSIKGLGICFEDIKDLHIDVCDACIRAKMRKLPVKPSQSNNNEERKPFEKVGADIVGKVQVKSIHGNHYFVFYVDYKTNYTVAYFIAKKNELLNTLEELEADYIKFYGHELKVLQSDSEAVFKDEKIANWCRKRNVRTHLSPPYLHEANGKAERNIQTVVEMARTYMLSSNAPPNVWEYAVALAVHNLNLTPRSSLNWKSPHELVTGEVPDISHLIPFYAKGWAYKYKDEPDARQFKFGELASNVRFLGYSKSSRNAFIVKTPNGKIMLRRDCQFDEHPLRPEDIPEKTPLDDHKEMSEDNFPEEPAENTAQDCDYSSDTEKDDPSPVSLHIRPQRERKQPERYGTFVGLVKEETPTHDITTPMNCRQALDENNPYRDNWRAAICAEMEEMYSRGSIVDVTMEEIKALGRRPFQAKFVFKVKVEPDASIKFKARLVVKGFTMIQGLDYDLTYSPTPNFFIAILLIHIATTFDYFMEAIDIANAYQEAKADKLMFMLLPKDYTGKVLMPVRLDGNINGTKQGALLWFSLLETVLIDFGFTPSKVEPCLFIKMTDGIIVYALVYVDDILIVSNRQEEIAKLQDHFLVHFKRITIQKEVKKFLGIQLFPQYRDDGSKYVTLSQPDYINDKFSTFSKNARQTPLPVAVDGIKAPGDPVQEHMMDIIGSMISSGPHQNGYCICS